MMNDKQPIFHSSFIASGVAMFILAPLSSRSPVMTI
jgi:hypothetical protein